MVIYTNLITEKVRDKEWVYYAKIEPILEVTKFKIIGLEKTNNVIGQIIKYI